jgi:hypothetical protein
MSAGSWRSAPLPQGWGRIRTIVLARDPVCRWGMLPGEVGGPCHQDSTEADHIGAADDHRVEMVRGLCRPHHIKRSLDQRLAAKAALRARYFRPAEPHPGFVRKGDALLCRHSCRSSHIARLARVRRHARPATVRAMLTRTSARHAIIPASCLLNGSRRTGRSRRLARSIPGAGVLTREALRHKAVQRDGLRN